MTRMRLSMMTAAALIVGGCSSSNAVEEGHDASKLDAEMEERAQEIEARADAAAVAAEREAAAELARIEAEARTAEQGRTAAAGAVADR
ncbi:MAG: hypothetical protein ABL882_00115 [Sphingopyxis sp.]